MKKNKKIKKNKKNDKFYAEPRNNNQWEAFWVFGKNVKYASPNAAANMRAYRKKKKK